MDMDGFIFHLHLTRTYPEPDEVGIGSVEEGLVANTAIRQVVEATDGGRKTAA